MNQLAMWRLDKHYLYLFANPIDCRNGRKCYQTGNQDSGYIHRKVQVYVGDMYSRFKD